MVLISKENKERDNRNKGEPRVDEADFLKSTLFIHYYILWLGKVLLLFQEENEV